MKVIINVIIFQKTLCNLLNDAILFTNLNIGITLDVKKVTNVMFDTL